MKENFIEGEGISLTLVNGKIAITNTMPNRNTFSSVIINNDLVVNSSSHTDNLKLSSSNYINITVDSNVINFSLDTTNIKANVTSEYISAKNLKIYGNTEKLKEDHRLLAEELYALNQIIESLKTTIAATYNQIIYWSKEDTLLGEEQRETFKIQYADLNKELGKLNDQAFKKMQRLTKLENSFFSPSVDLTYNTENAELQSNKVFRSPFVLENLTENQKAAIIDPTTGRMIYNTTTNKVQVFAKNTWIDLH